jgi:hypothetical protein
LTRQSRLLRSRLLGLALAVGLWAIAGGCGGTTGSGTGTEGEKVPEGIVKLKESMKEKAAARKARPGAPRGTAGP